MGASAALGVYLLLHPEIFSVFRAADWASVDQGHFPVHGGFVSAYFFIFKRHWPELAVVLAAIVICMLGNKKHLFRDWPALSSAAILVGAALLRWPNIAYFAFLAPFLLFFVLQVFYNENRRYWIVAAVLLFTLPQYVHRYKLWSLSNPGFLQRDDRQADEAITRAAAVLGKPAGQLNLLGDYALWFAHPHLFTNLHKKIINPNAPPAADLILCLDHPFEPLARSTQELLCTDLNTTAYQQMDEITLNHRRVHLFVAKQVKVQR